MSEQHCILTLSCRNQPGIVSAITTYLFEEGCDIVESSQFDDGETGRFFMRLVFGPMRDPAVLDRLRLGLASIAHRFDMTCDLRRRSESRRVLVLASKFDHCLADLLYRWRTGELAMDLVGVVSNHPADTYAHLDLAGVSFHHLPVTQHTKAEQECALWDVIQSSGADLVVLARYMQVLSDDMASRLAGRAINIHHSFLPGFKGAKPYHQAHQRGVKLIGATAHYVTGELDEGPIIEQDVERISHDSTPERPCAPGTTHRAAGPVARSPGTWTAG